MSHEELLDDAGMPLRPFTASTSTFEDAVEPAESVTDLSVADHVDVPADHDEAMRPRRRRRALAVLAVAVAGLMVAGTIHEVDRWRDRRALARTVITVDQVLFDIRSLLYARLAGSPPTTRVPVRLAVTNGSGHPVRLLALQVGGVPIEPIQATEIAPGATVTVRGTARAACPAGNPDPAPGLTRLPEGQGLARLADGRGNRVTVALRAWPGTATRLPSGAACDEISLTAPPLRL